MEVKELIEILKTFDPTKEVRVYREGADGIRSAVLVVPSGVLSVNTLSREARGLPEFIIIAG